MSDLFADTSFYLAIVNPADRYHGVANSRTQSLRGRIVTTEYVLVETGNALRRGLARRLYAELFARITEDRETAVVPASSGLLGAGFDLFAAYSDKDWSLTDCISFVVMREHGLTEALTADHHFEQAGFVALLK